MGQQLFLCGELKSLDLGVAKASFNSSDLVMGKRLETKWSNHEQVENKEILIEGPNPRMWKDAGMTCG